MYNLKQKYVGKTHLKNKIRTIYRIRYQQNSQHNSAKYLDINI